MFSDFSSRIVDPTVLSLEKVGSGSYPQLYFKDQELYLTVGSREQWFCTAPGDFLSNLDRYSKEYLNSGRGSNGLKKRNHELRAPCMTLQHFQEFKKSLRLLFVELDVLETAPNAL